jgi:endonuclease/exonuclease/phosphatase family metal-dependent hydrolase
MKIHSFASACLLLVTGAACHTPMNYTSVVGPRYAATAAPRPPAREDCVVRVVTFNIQWARHTDSAIALLQSNPSLQDADIITLQEMDDPATRRVAEALGMSYVYYPSTLHPQSKRDFGNAILSRWPITDDRKLILPHLGRFAKTERTATTATVTVGVPVQVYSVHLATWIERGPGQRREQARAVVDDAARYDRVILSGDMNSHGSAKWSRGGYVADRSTTFYCKARELGSRVLEGHRRSGRDEHGVVRDNRHASDHHPCGSPYRSTESDEPSTRS